MQPAGGEPGEGSGIASVLARAQAAIARAKRLTSACEDEQITASALALAASAAYERSTSANNEETIASPSAVLSPDRPDASLSSPLERARELLARCGGEPLQRAASGDAAVGDAASPSARWSQYLAARYPGIQAAIHYSDSRRQGGESSSTAPTAAPAYHGWAPAPVSHWSSLGLAASDDADGAIRAASSAALIRRAVAAAASAPAPIAPAPSVEGASESPSLCAAAAPLSVAEEAAALRRELLPAEDEASGANGAAECLRRAQDAASGTAAALTSIAGRLSQLHAQQESTMRSLLVLRVEQARLRKQQLSALSGAHRSCKLRLRDCETALCGIGGCPCHIASLMHLCLPCRGN